MKFTRRASESWTVIRRFAPELRPFARALLVVVLLGLGAAGLELLRPWPVQWIFDGALVPTGGAGEPTPGLGRLVAVLTDRQPGPESVLIFGVALVVIVSVGRSLLEYARTLRLADVGHRVTRSLRARLFEQLTRLSPRFHAEHKSGDLLVRLMGDVPMLRTMLVDSSVELGIRFVLVVATVAVMLAVDPWLTLLVLGVIPAVALAVRVLSRRITSAVRKQRRKEGAVADFLHEAVSAVQVLQSLGQEQAAAQRFRRDNRSSERAGLRARRLAARLSVTVESLLGVVVAGTLALGGHRVLEGELSPGELLVFVSYVRGLLKPIRAASRHGERIAKGAACGERILEVLDHEVEVISRPGAPLAPRRPQVLEWRDVSYSYGDGVRGVSAVDLELRRGDCVALLGPSGAGKSTLTSLAVRLIDPQAGSVRLDDVDLREWELGSLRERFGVCLQDTVLFGDTVRENLLIGAPDADEEQLRRACRDAGVDLFLAGMPGGLDAPLGAAGAGLSGGERRRLALARTLLREAPILIVDEPFNGLDEHAATRVMDTLRDRSANGMVLVVTHGQEHLARFDRIVRMRAGRLDRRAEPADLELSP